MPNGNDQSNPKDPGSGAGTGTGSGAGEPKGTGSQDGASPNKVEKPPQTGIVVAAAVGGLIGGVMVEILFLGDVPAGPAGPHRGYTNISFRVADLDGAYETLRSQHPEVRTEPAVDIGGVRMFFVYDPDDTPIEILELPGGARTTVELWRPGA